MFTVASVRDGGTVRAHIVAVSGVAGWEWEWEWVWCVCAVRVVGYVG